MYVGGGTDEHAVQSAPPNPTPTVDKEEEDDEEPSVLEALSDDQLARRPSFKYVFIMQLVQYCIKGSSCLL